jgi:hypothetical protein
LRHTRLSPTSVILNTYWVLDFFLRMLHPWLNGSDDHPRRGERTRASGPLERDVS